MDTPRWEYRVEEIPGGPHQGQLRNWGADGWDLVAETVLRTEHGHPVIRAVFKRPRD